MLKPVYKDVYLCKAPNPANALRMDMLSLPMISSMEQNGMRVDKGFMSELHTKITLEMEGHAANVEKLTGYSINLASGDQLADLLFVKLGLKQQGKEKWTKSKARLASDGDVLRGMISKHPAIRDILKWKELEKLRSTYTFNLIKQADENDRIHCDINHTGPETGRLSCVAPWTEIPTKNGKKKIKDVKIGDMVWTHRRRWRRVTEVIYKGTEPMVSITFCTGDVLTCTVSHKLLIWEHEHIKTVVEKGIQHSGSVEDVPVEGIPDRANNSGFFGYHLPYCTVDMPEQNAQSRIPSTSENTVFTFEAGGKEPHVWEDRGETSQLDWDSGRWIRVSDLLKERQAPICSQDCNRGSFGVERTPGYVRCASCGREYEEQRVGQPSSGNSEGTPNDTLFTEKRQGFCCIKEIYHAGSIEVYDITVEEDESYLACGVFSHNSSQPNLQNVPIRTMLGREIRNAFIPKKGNVIGTVDASQIEMRTMCEDASCEPMLWIFLNFEDLYWGVAEKIYIRKFSKEERKHGIDPGSGQTFKNYYRFNAKTTALGVTYAISPPGLVDLFLTSDPPAIYLLTGGETEWDFDRHYEKAVSICGELINRFFLEFYQMLSRRREHHKFARMNGFNHDMWGRIRWCPQVYSTHKYVQEEGLRGAGNIPGQGGAAGIIKLWMAKIWDRVESYWGKAGIMMLMQVHDELVCEGPPTVVPDFLKECERTLEDLLEPDQFQTPLAAESDCGERWGKLK